MFDPKDPSRIINFRPLFIAAVGLMCGISGFYTLRSIDSNSVLGIILLCAAVLAAAVLLIAALRKKKLTACILLAALLIGAARMSLAKPDSCREGDYTVTGTVFDISDSDPTVVTLVKVRLNGQKVNYKLKLSTENGYAKVGQRIEAFCSVKIPNRRFGTYDERLAMLANGVSLQGKCSGFTVLSENELPFRTFFYGLRQTLHARIYELFVENAPIAAGFLLGERSGMDEADYDSFSETGTAHLLTLSGFHVAVLAGLLFFLLPKRYPWLRFIIVGLFLIVYCAVTAFSPSLVRASLMCMCVMTADLTERRADPLSSLSLAAIIILIVSPYKLYSLGFRLSFAATFGILMFTRNPLRISAGRIPRYLLGILTVTAAATVATSMFVANAFGELPTYGILSNLTAVPLFSAAVTVSFAALIIGLPVPVLGRGAAWAANRLIDAAMTVLGLIRRLPNSTVSVMRPSALTGVILLALMFAASPYVLRPAKKKVSIVLALLFLFTASLFADIIRS